MAEGTSQVKIPADSSSASAHNIRTIIIPNPNLGAQSADGLGTLTPTSEEQQVITIAGADGDLATVVDGALSGHDEETHRLLRGICKRLDMLNEAVQKTYSPPDNIWSEE